MVLALSAENREQGSARKQALPARLLMEGGGGGEQEGWGEGEQWEREHGEGEQEEGEQGEWELLGGGQEGEQDSARKQALPAWL